MIVPVPRSAGATSEDSVLPLINIVFLLLIFFMIAGTLTSSGPFDIEPPGAQSPEAAEPPQGGVAIAADGRLAFAGAPVAAAELSARARRWRRQEANGEPLAVHVDADAPTERLLRAIEALREAGVERIRLFAVGRARTN